MIDDAEERRIRAAAIEAAGSFVGGQGMNGADVHTLLYVAEVVEQYIKSGTRAALSRYEQGPHTEAAAQGSPQAAYVTDGGSSPNSITRAQELADEAYTALSQTQVDKILDVAEREGVAGDSITIAGKSGPLGAFLKIRADQLPTNTPSGSAVEDLRSALNM